MIVIDCSIFMAAVMEDESSLVVSNVLDDLSSGKLDGIVPELFFTEAANVVVSNVKRKRITRQQADFYFDLFVNAPLEVDRSVDIKSCAGLAIDYDLSVYDAIYLHLAVKKGCMLATLNKKLVRVSKSLGCYLEDKAA